MTRIGLVVAASTIALVVVSAQTPSASALYQEALHVQEVKGDVRKAIEIYRTIVARHGSDAKIAPQALLQLASCYEKIGSAEALPTYQRILTDYGASGTAASTARTRIDALEQKSQGLSTRTAWTGSDVDVEGRVSNGGNYLSFVDWNRGTLAIRDLSSGRVRQVTQNTDDWDEFPEVSAPSYDGRLIAYGWRHPKTPYQLRVISRNGGTPQTLMSDADVDYLQPFDWTRDGRQILVVVQRGLRRPFTDEIAIVPASGGPARVVKRSVEPAIVTARFSPDGLFIAYSVRSENGRDGNVFIMPASGGTETAVASHSADDLLLDWSPDGQRLLFSSDRGGSVGVWQVAMASGKPVGDPSLVRAGIGDAKGLGFGKNGTYYVGTEENVQDAYVATLDPATGRMTSAPQPIEGRFVGGKLQGAWSPTGEDIAYVIPAIQDRPRGLSILTVASGRTRTISLAMPLLGYPAWLPDGRAVMIQGRNAEGRQGIHRIDLASGQATLVTEGDRADVDTVGGKQQPALSRDGNQLFFSVGGGTRGVAVRDLNSGEERSILSVPIFRFAVAPDGNTIAVTRGTSGGGPVLRVGSISGGELRALVPKDHSGTSNRVIAWSPDGRYVYYARHPGQGVAIWRAPVDGGEPQNTGITLRRDIQQLRVHPDGTRLLISTNSVNKELLAFENLPPLPARR